MLVWSIWLICKFKVENESKDNRETDFCLSGAQIMKHNVIIKNAQQIQLVLSMWSPLKNGKYRYEKSYVALGRKTIKEGQFLLA